MISSMEWLSLFNRCVHLNLCLADDPESGLSRREQLDALRRRSEAEVCIQEMILGITGNHTTVVGCVYVLEADRGIVLFGMALS